MPQTIVESPVEKAFDLDTGPDFIQQVPPFHVVHVKCVQPGVLTHLPLQSSPRIWAFVRSPSLKSQAKAQSPGCQVIAPMMEVTKNGINTKYFIDTEIYF
jgi:hypothetical protein